MKNSEKEVKGEAKSGFLVVELVALILVVDSDGENGRVRQEVPVRLVHLCHPLALGETGRHVVDVFDADGGRTRPLETSPVHGHNLATSKSSYNQIFFLVKRDSNPIL